MQVGSGRNLRLEVSTKPFPRCGEHSCCRDREDALEYADEKSKGSYHTLKVAKENVIPLHVLEPTLLPADRSCLLSDNKNIPPCAVTPPPLNVLIPIEEEIEAGV